MADPEPFDADPDPDPTFQADADPAPDPNPFTRVIIFFSCLLKLALCDFSARMREEG